MLNRSTRIAALAASALAIGATLAPTGASADWRYRNNGGAIAAGVIGGLALGALAAGAASRPAYGAYYDAPPPPVYYRPRPVYSEMYGYAPVCRVVKQRVQIDPWTVEVRRYRVCD